MSFFKAKKSAEDLAQSSGSNYLNASGCYPVNIVAPFVSVGQKGSTSVDLYLEHAGQAQVIYGNMRVTNNDGTENVIGAKVFNQLMIIADVEEVGEPVDAELPIGKKGAGTDVGVLEDLADIDVILRMQMEYSAWNGNIQEKKVIKGFFRAEDMASAEEIVNETEPGVQYAKEGKYFEHVTYKDGLDAETIEAWIAAKRPKGTAGKGAATGGAPAGKKPTFGKKKTFGAKKDD